MSDPARLDYLKKIELENKLKPKVLKEFRNYGRNYFARLIGREAIEYPLYGNLAGLLEKHYHKVAGQFTGRYDLPPNLAMTDEEQSALSLFLAGFFSRKASAQAKVITDTTRKNENESMIAANEEASNRRADGESVDHIEVYALAAGVLASKLKSRAGTIATYETQQSAEVAKKAEAGVLMGAKDNPLSGPKRPSGLLKTWRTVGDERVRPWHSQADGQTVPENEPFIVGGEKLMMPGDTSLGASIENVINCRCSEIINEADMIAERERILTFDIYVEGPFRNDSL